MTHAALTSDASSAVSQPVRSRRSLLVVRLIGVLATVLALLTVTGCSVDATERTVTVTVPTSGDLTVLLTDEAQSPGITPPQQTFTDGMATRNLTGSVRVSSSADAQLQQLESVSSDATLLVQPWPDTRVSSRLEALKDSGATVIVVLNRPTSLKAASLIVGWNDFGAGERQFASLMQAMQQRRPNDLVTIEHTASDPRNVSDRMRFNGTMWALKPYGKAGAIATKTGQTSWSQVSTPGNDQALLARRLGVTVEATYPRWPLDGVITGSPAEADTVLAATAQLDPAPLVMTDGATTEVMSKIGQGTLFGTTYRDPAVVITLALDTVVSLRAGKPLVTNPHVSFHNRYDTLLAEVPALLVTPEIVTKATAATVLRDNPTLLAAVTG